MEAERRLCTVQHWSNRWSMLVSTGFLCFYVLPQAERLNMRYACQFLVTRASLIAIGVMLTVPLPAMAGEIHREQTGGNVSLGEGALNDLNTGNSNTASGFKAL